MDLITTINLHLYGPGSDTQSIQARQLKKGFSVVMIPDKEILIEPFRVGSTTKEYCWRTFARMVCQIEEGFITPELCKFVTVKGESGIRAEILTLAWSYYEGDRSFIDWLMAQSEASLDYIEQGIGSILEEDTQAVLVELADTLFCLYGETDLIKRLPLHSSLNKLYDSLLEKRMEERQKEHEKLAPFKEAIDAIMENWAEQHPFKGGMNARMGYSARLGAIRLYIENWVLKHSEIPTGVHDIGTTKKWNIKIGEIDFNDLITTLDG